jgi:methanogenic corrinoid protein MtbC1
MAWALEARPGVEHVVGYEAGVDHVLRRWSDPVVCTYDRTRFTAAAAMDAFGAHRIGCVGGALRRNPLFSAPRMRSSSVLELLRRRYLAALLAGSLRDAIEIVVEEGPWLDAPIASLYLHVVQPAQHAIGRLWAQGRVTVADEHAATEISRLASAALRAYFTGHNRLGKVITVACVAGERHDLGARLVADVLEMEGYEVRYLGADVPTETLVALARDDAPDVLALSATSTESLPALRAAVRGVRAVNDTLLLAAGGQLFGTRPGLQRELGITLYAPDPGALAVRLQRVFGSDSDRVVPESPA